MNKAKQKASHRYQRFPLRRALRLAPQNQTFPLASALHKAMTVDVALVYNRREFIKKETEQMCTFQALAFRRLHQQSPVDGAVPFVRACAAEVEASQPARHYVHFNCINNEPHTSVLYFHSLTFSSDAVQRLRFAISAPSQSFARGMRRLFALQKTPSTTLFQSNKHLPKRRYCADSLQLAHIWLSDERAGGIGGLTFNGANTLLRRID